MLYRVERYEQEAEEWNEFVRRSRQGTFLFDRNYMDYHRDRFDDFSLKVYRKDALFALLPANKSGTTFWSHQGLTYGGLLTDDNATAVSVCDAFKAINDYLSATGFEKIIYKAVPFIYHRVPSEEDLYAVTNVCNARLIVRDISSVLVKDRRLQFKKDRKSGIGKARRNGIVVRESRDWAELGTFWQVLSDNLRHKFNVRPVHSLDEIKLLMSWFPRQIRLFIALKDGVLCGGTIIYETPNVIHSQYISASPEGKAVGALDMLHDYLLNKVYADAPCFDFGKSSENGGHELNEGLIYQKEGFGGRAACYDWYEWTL